MKLKNQVLVVISPILFAALLLLGITSLILKEELASSELSFRANQEHNALTNRFTEMFTKNDSDIFLITHVELINELFTKFDTTGPTPQLVKSINNAFAYMSVSNTNKFNWLLFDQRGESVTSVGDEISVLEDPTFLTNLIEQHKTSQKTQRLLMAKGGLRALTVIKVFESSNKPGTNLYLAVTRHVPAPEGNEKPYAGIAYYAVNNDASVYTYSPRTNPYNKTHTVEVLAAMESTDEQDVLVSRWTDFTVYTVSNLKYAFDWKPQIILTFTVLFFTFLAALGLIVFALNRAVIKPVAWLSDFVKTESIFNKPELYPVLGSDEIRTLYRGIVKSARRLNLIRRRMERTSLLDDLTGLGNRRHFHRNLESAIASNHRNKNGFALVLIDLDNFKYVNDAYGHHIGDELLVQFSNLLNEQTRVEDAIYNIIDAKNISRLGGDEFAIILNDLKIPENAVNVANRVIYEMERGIVIDGIKMPVTASIGIANYPEDAETANELMLCVDAAMYKAKRSGKNGYQFYSKQIASNLAKELAIETHLRKDFKANELQLYVQPFFNTDDLTLAGGEVLLRWYNEELGIVGPDEFIPVAEKIGLIREIDIWVIEQVCQFQTSYYQANGQYLIGLAVNISAVETRNPLFAQSVATVCEKYNFSPSLLELEITETALIEDLEAAAVVTNQLREMGIKIALDDFGTGYSSISHLKDVNFDKLKIDRSFISEIDNKNDTFLVTDISLLLAHGMRMEITAEGVETNKQLQYLKMSGCDYVQGYLLEKPMPITDYMKFVVNNHSK